MVYNGAAYRYVHHVEGDIIAVVDAAGNTVVQYVCGARREKKGVTGPMATTLGKHNPFRYRGYVYGEETWIYCLRSRYYYPELQRFIGADTNVYMSFFGTNPFAYCQNLPTLLEDSNGALGLLGILDAVIRTVTKIVAVHNKRQPKTSFDASVPVGMQEKMRSSDQYSYRKKGHSEPKKTGVNAGRGGEIDCAYFLYTSRPPVLQCDFSGATPRYYDSSTRKNRGTISSIGGIGHLIPGMEVFQKEDNSSSMKHVGLVVLHDFGDGLELAVAHSVTGPLSRVNYKALFYDDINGGPNITSFSSEWTHYAWPKNPW